MSTADAAALAQPLTAAEAKSLFADLTAAPAILLAVSGGPDSTALLVLAARWRAARKRGPKLLAVTIDHGLRPEAAAEARQVGRLARKLGVAHRTIRWRGKKPNTRLQETARAARYRLLAQAAKKTGASHVLTAHTRDDQAETVLMRFLRGSGPAGLAGMAQTSPVPGESALILLRPFLAVPKARLIATLQAAGIPFTEDPSNLDPRFTRVRMRGLLAVLAEEGLSPGRLTLLARRAGRAEAALAAATERAATELSLKPPAAASRAFDAAGFAALPAEIGLRLLGQAVAAVGHEGPVELSKLEALYAALAEKSRPKARFRQTLAGAMVTLSEGRLLVERAPARRR